MKRVSEINAIFEIQKLDLMYVHGVAECTADYDTVKVLEQEGFFDKSNSYADGPTNGQIVEFMDKYHNRGVELKLLVMDPSRDDFRINVKAVSIPPEQARINSDEDMRFWMDFMNLGKMGCVKMVEDNVQISWEWFNG